MKSLGSIRKSFAPWDDPAAKPYISFENVTKRFGDFTAVNDLTLLVYEREFFSLLGPSGCGKTTTMRMIAGLEDITEGDITIDGKVINDLEPKDRDISMVFQSFALMPHMTVLDNTALGLELAGADRAQRQAQAGSPSQAVATSHAYASLTPSVSCTRSTRPQGAPSACGPAGPVRKVCTCPATVRV